MYTNIKLLRYIVDFTIYLGKIHVTRCKYTIETFSFGISYSTKLPSFSYRWWYRYILQFVHYISFIIYLGKIHVTKCKYMIKTFKFGISYSTQWPPGGRQPAIKPPARHWFYNPQVFRSRLRVARSPKFLGETGYLGVYRPVVGLDVWIGETLTFFSKKNDEVSSIQYSRTLRTANTSFISYITPHIVWRTFRGVGIIQR